jgi:ferredoxin
MAYKIVASQCSACGACEFECPNAAISMKRDAYVIDPGKCSECDGSPQCVSVCPVAGTCIPA